MKIKQPVAASLQIQYAGHHIPTHLFTTEPISKDFNYKNACSRCLNFNRSILQSSEYN